MIENIGICYIVIGVLLMLNIIIIAIAVKCAHRLPDDFEFYDEDGDHIYYDRKLIRDKKRTNGDNPTTKNPKSDDRDSNRDSI
ncbi:MAG: hypothetical protein SNH27_16560 [Rikenellaceae bacterium]